MHLIHPSTIANQVIDCCASTNDLVRQLGELGFPHGTWISARSQEKGRGRLGREWLSLEGNLFLSILIRLEDFRKECWTWMPLTAAVGVTDCVRNLFPGLDIRIKWPNDLWVFQGSQGAKLGGILCEAVGGPKGAFMVVGIGVNCAQSPRDLDQSTACLAEALAGAGQLVDQLRLPIKDSVLTWLRRLGEAGSAQISSKYERWAVFPPGAWVEWTEFSTGTLKTGQVLGLGAAGELKVLSADGVEKQIYAEDVKLRAARVRSD